MKIVIDFFLWIGSSREACMAFVCTTWAVCAGVAYIKYQLEEKKKWKEAEKARRRKDSDDMV